MSQILIDEPTAGVRRLTLNRPEQLNAFTYDMYARLIEILEEVRRDSAIRGAASVDAVPAKPRTMPHIPANIVGLMRPPETFDRDV